MSRSNELHIPTKGRAFGGQHEAQCCFCFAERRAVSSLVAASTVSICERCIARCVHELKKRRIDGWRRWWDFREPAAVDEPAAGASPYRDERAGMVCSFCRRDGGAKTLVAAQARICSACVRLAAAILREAKTPDAARAPDAVEQKHDAFEARLDEELRSLDD